MANQLPPISASHTDPLSIKERSSTDLFCKAGIALINQVKGQQMIKHGGQISVMYIGTEITNQMLANVVCEHTIKIIYHN